MSKPREVEGVRHAVMLAGSQKKLAEILGVSTIAVNRWVKQGYVPNKRVKEIYDLYGIPKVRLCNPAFLELIANEEDKDA